MTSPKLTINSPLRDRLFSNSPDPMKSSILRESGLGWSSPPSTTSIPESDSHGSVISPLRISKRDSPSRHLSSAVARRSSSSYKHVRNNNLVSKSPFKSQIPTPSSAVQPRRPPIPFPVSPARRISGEKRPRPSSMHEQAELENERPFSLKRDRRQSKTYQGLYEKEPVTKSPFRRLGNSNEEESSTTPFSPPGSSSRKPLPAFNSTPSRIPPPPPTGSSPTRSSLVSKRLHGPRLSGGRRERRKTVTWDERCDVVEFENDEEMEEDVFDTTASDMEEDYGQGDHADDPFFLRGPSDSVVHDSTLDDSIQLPDSGINELDLDPDVSITGIVDEMLAATPATPPRHGDLPPDLETEDGVPLGRTHHQERAAEIHRQEAHSHTADSHDEEMPHALLPQSLPHSPATPPRRPREQNSPISPPLGRSTHAERLHAARAQEEETEHDVMMLPDSPSPVKKNRHRRSTSESLIPRLDLPGDESIENISLSGADPFVLPSLQNEPLPDAGAAQDDSVGPSDLSSLEQELSSPIETIGFKPSTPMEEQHDISAPPPDLPNTRCQVTSPRVLSPSGSSSSLVGRTGSPLGGRPRINREDVQKRLLRSVGSPARDVSPPQRHTPLSPGVIPEPQSHAELEHTQSTKSTSRIESRAWEDEENDKDAVSVLTVVTDISTESATIQVAEKRNLSSDQEFGMLAAPDHGERLKFDFGSRFGLGGLGIAGLNDADFSEIPADKDDPSSRYETASQADEQRSLRMEVGPVDVDMDMRSALDRLMDDVAGGKMEGDVSMATTEGDVDDPMIHEPQVQPRIMERAATDSALVVNGPGSGIMSRSVSGSSATSIPPPVPPKDNIRSREALILEKRREARRIEAEESDEFYGAAPRHYLSVGKGRASRRRSMSTGDADDLSKKVLQHSGGSLLDIGPSAPGDDGLSELIAKELVKREGPLKKSYHIRQHEETIYASSDDGAITHMAGPGDVNTGKAWRPVRRPSDMNEYSKQIKEYRAQEHPGKAYGKVFLKVLGVRGIHVPVPLEATALTCTLNNGIHFVTTPECRLAPDCKIEQEFELIEHSKLELTLTLKVRRDPHIISQFKALAPKASPQPPPMLSQPSSRSGMRSFFSSSPKKPSKDKLKPAPPPQPVHRLPDNLARYLKPDGTLARAFIAFKDIAHHCDTRLFETTYPLIGQRVELGNKFSTLQVGEIVLQVFRLPPLPGIAPDQLPQSLEECHRGLRHINWHKVTYFEGTLTQNGGDCRSWRRRQLRVIGANLVAFNDVTKRATATINLKKAIAVEDDQEARNNALSPSSQVTSRSRYADEYEGLYGVERSFRLIFPAEEIVFFADTDEEKARWLEVLRALVGHIPPHPLWAELLWQRQEELSKRAQAAARGPQSSSRAS